MQLSSLIWRSSKVSLEVLPSWLWGLSASCQSGTSHMQQQLPFYQAMAFTSSSRSSSSSNDPPSTPQPDSLTTTAITDLLTMRGHPLGRPLQHLNETPATYSPWTASRLLVRKGHAQRRMRFLVKVLENEAVAAAMATRRFPDFRTGDILEVRVLLPENERKEYMYRGVCIARSNAGPRTTFKLYNVFPESGGFVQHFPLYMPDMIDIKVVGSIRAGKGRLNYLLERETKDLMFQEYVKQTQIGQTKDT